MGQIDKIKKKFYAYNKDISFEDAIRLLWHLGFEQARVKGDHFVFSNESIQDMKISHIVIARGKGIVKEYSVEDIVEILEYLEGNND